MTDPLRLCYKGESYSLYSTVHAPGNPGREEAFAKELAQAVRKRRLYSSVIVQKADIGYGHPQWGVWVLGKHPSRCKRR
jgi:hypothetical protein